MTDSDKRNMNNVTDPKMECHSSPTLFGESECVYESGKSESDSELPSRNPLHPNALNMSDLAVGMSIMTSSERGTCIVMDEAVIIGKPFRRGWKYTRSHFRSDDWMIPVETGNRRKPVTEWYLSDIGVIPHYGEDGPYWDDHCYTIAFD